MAGRVALKTASDMLFLIWVWSYRAICVTSWNKVGMYWISNKWAFALSHQASYGLQCIRRLLCESYNQKD